MRYRPLFAVAAVGVLAAFSLGSTSAAATTSQSSIFADDPELVRSVASALKISTDDASHALTDSQAIYDFQLAHEDNEAFGAIWATYDTGYEVHVRSRDDSLESDISGLEKQLGRKVQRSIGGAPYRALRDFAEGVHDDGLDLEYELDFAQGAIDISAQYSIPTQLVDASYVHVVESVTPPDGHKVVSHAGNTVYNLINGVYTWTCTSGLMYRGASGSGGYATAGHCPNGNTYVAGGNYSAAPTYSYHSCVGNDVQVQAFQYLSGNFPPGSLFKWAGSYYNMYVAGGYYIGQIAFMSGTASGSSQGTVSGFGSYSSPAGGDCPAANINGIKVTNIAQNGDSGGPVVLVYGSANYLAGIISTTYSNGTVSSWVPWVPLPSGTHICNLAAPCGQTPLP